MTSDFEAEQSSVSITKGTLMVSEGGIHLPQQKNL